MSSTLTPFLKEKYVHLFRRFYDSNKNGVVTHSDFLDLLTELQQMRGWGPGDSRLKESEKALNSAWNALKQGADTDQDQAVTMDEWLAYWGGFVQKSKSGGGWPSDAAWVKEYMKFWFDFMDTSGDNKIDEDEYAKVFTHFGMTDSDARTAFKKFAKEPIDKKSFEQLWLQYMTSDDKSAPGNFVFGH